MKMNRPNGQQCLAKAITYSYLVSVDFTFILFGGGETALYEVADSTQMENRQYVILRLARFTEPL